MSLKDAFTNQITTRTSAAANSFISSALGLDRKKETPIPTLKRKGPFSTRMLSYPIDVGDNPEHGHWIKFEISKYKQIKTKDVLPDVSKITTKQAVESMSGESRPSKAAKKANPHGATMEGAGQQNGDLAAQQAAAAVTKAVQSVGKWTSDTASSFKRGTKHLATSVSLYMPPSLTVNYKSNFEDVEIGVLAETGANVIKAFSTEKAAWGMMDAVHAGISGAATAGKKAFIEGVDSIAPGSKALLQIEAGMIHTPRMELMFNGMGRRQFSFTFTMIPKNEREAQTIQEIVHAFKYHMAAEVSNIREQTIPETFKITYMYRSKPNNFLNKISECYCTDVNVTYGGDRAVFYDESSWKGGSGAPPQRTTIALTFNEMAILGKTDIEKGF